MTKNNYNGGGGGGDDNQHTLVVAGYRFKDGRDSTL